MATCLRPQACFVIPKLSCIVKPNIRGVLVGRCQLSLKRPSCFQIRSSINNNNNHHQLFEDRSQGIICYRDEKGEIICEGYDDEGPRFQQNTSRPSSSCHLRDMEIMNLLQQNWIQIAKGKGNSDVYRGELGFILLQEADINNSNNGFNTFHN